MANDDLDTIKMIQCDYPVDHLYKNKADGIGAVGFGTADVFLDGQLVTQISTKVSSYDQTRFSANDILYNQIAGYVTLPDENEHTLLINVKSESPVHFTGFLFDGNISAKPKQEEDPTDEPGQEKPNAGIQPEDDTPVEMVVGIVVAVVVAAAGVAGGIIIYRKRNVNQAKSDEEVAVVI